MPTSKRKPTVPLETSSVISLKETLYTKVSWKSVKDVYKCVSCGWDEDSEDDMQLHVLSHYPPEERDDILDKILTNNKEI